MADEGFTIEVIGADALISKFIRGEAMATGLLLGAMSESVSMTKNEAQIYPPESEANQPPPPYYIRGVGTQYTNHNRLESRQLGSNWDTSIGRTEAGLEGTVWNDRTPYAPFLHSITRQRALHAGRGWRTVKQIGEAVQERVFEKFRTAVTTLANFMNG